MTKQKTKEEILKEVMNRFQGVLTWSSGGRIYIEDAINESYQQGKSSERKRILDIIENALKECKLRRFGIAYETLITLYKQINQSEKEETEK